jgi:hypothetical protein
MTVSRRTPIRRNNEKIEKDAAATAPEENPRGREGVEPSGRDFSAYNREIRSQIDPQTQERVELLTKKQFLDLQKKKLKEF